MNGKSCYEAKTIAEKCALAASGDAVTAGNASTICQKKFAKNDGDKALYTKLAKRCADKYAKSQGTLYISAAAFCQLDAAALLADLNSSPDE
jgi:hypothetical protein